MSTRSIIAKGEGDGWVQGRFCMSDGYPTWMGRVLQELVQRDGVDKVVETLTIDNWAWSSINPQQPDIKGVRADAKADYGTAAWYAYAFRGKHGQHSGGGHLNVPGYGTAWTMKHDGPNTEAMWYPAGEPEDTEWAYALSAGGLAIYTADDHFKPVSFVRWDDTQDEAGWYRVECGEHFERCNHCAYVHFPETDSRLGVAQYLGLEPMTIEDAVGVIIDGERWDIGGSGRLERVVGGYGRRWFAGAHHPGTDIYRDVHTYDYVDGVKVPNPDLTFIYPPLKELHAT
jgi:hypothetical protein